MGTRCQISACYTQQNTWVKKKGKIRVYWVNLIGLGFFYFLILKKFHFAKYINFYMTFTGRRFLISMMKLLTQRNKVKKSSQNSQKWSIEDAPMGCEKPRFQSLFFPAQHGQRQAGTDRKLGCPASPQVSCKTRHLYGISMESPPSSICPSHSRV